MRNTGGESAVLVVPAGQADPTVTNVLAARGVRVTVERKPPACPASTGLPRLMAARRVPAGERSLAMAAGTTLVQTTLDSRMP